MGTGGEGEVRVVIKAGRNVRGLEAGTVEYDALVIELQLLEKRVRQKVEGEEMEMDEAL